MTASLPQTFRPPGGPLLHLADSGGTGRPVLFQHGLCGDAHQPAEVFPAGPLWRLLTLECRGHGTSQAGDPAAFAIATFADDLIALIEHHGLAPLVIGGISMGAAIALRVAVTRPDLVKTLILARPAWETDAAPANMAPNAEAGALLSAFPSGMARERFESSATARRLAAEAPDNLASLRGFFSRAPQNVTAGLLTAISGDGPGVTPEDVGRLAIPALVIGHGRDAVHPLLLARRLAARVPGARFVEITPKAEDKARYVRDFRDAIRTFLMELP